MDGFVAPVEQRADAICLDGSIAFGATRKHTYDGPDMGDCLLKGSGVGSCGGTDTRGRAEQRMLSGARRRLIAYGRYQ
jgi:hypothetical protein